MKYQVIFNNTFYPIGKNRKELIKFIQSRHAPMYYCTNGAHNYKCRTMCEIFNNLEKDNNNGQFKIVYNQK